MSKNFMKSAEQGVCPCCGSDDIEYGIAEVEFPTGVYQDCTCNKCGANFDEWYDIKFSGQWNISADTVGEDCDHLYAPTDSEVE